MPIKAVFFDIDGTLVDSNDLHVKAWAEAFESAGIQVEPRAIRAQIGKGTDNLVPTLLPDATEEQEKALGEAHGAIFQARYLSLVTPFPHARDLLQRVHDAGQKVVLASSASKGELDYYIARLDIRAIVFEGTSSDDVENTKPAPDIFAVALKKVAPLTAAEVIVVGDTPYDIEAAAKCGIAAIGVRSGKFPDDALRSAGAVALYDDPAALLADYDRSPLAR